LSCIATAAQRIMTDITISSHHVLSVLIDQIYNRAIMAAVADDDDDDDDEDNDFLMHAELCVHLSQSIVPVGAFVHVIVESSSSSTSSLSNNQPAAEPQQRSQHQPPPPPPPAPVYRWSNHVGTDDLEIVGPFTSITGCINVASRRPAPILAARFRGTMELELVQVLVQDGIYIKIMKKKTHGDHFNTSTTNESSSRRRGQQSVNGGSGGGAGEYYTVYFPVAEAHERGQQLSEIFATREQAVVDANKKNSFKRNLLNKCQEEFSKQNEYVDWKRKMKEYEQTKDALSKMDRAHREQELVSSRMSIKNQRLGNVKFIGQLYNKKLLTEKIIRLCLSSLLRLDHPDDDFASNFDTSDGDNNDDDHEAIGVLLTTIGSTLDKPASVDFIDGCFDKILKLSHNETLPARLRTMYNDLLELRNNQWVPRRRIDMDSSTVTDEDKVGGTSGEESFLTYDSEASSKSSNVAAGNAVSDHKNSWKKDTDDEKATTLRLPELYGAQGSGEDERNGTLSPTTSEPVSCQIGMLEDHEQVECGLRAEIASLRAIISDYKLQEFEQLKETYRRLQDQVAHYEQKDPERLKSHIIALQEKVARYEQQLRQEQQRQQHQDEDAQYELEWRLVLCRKNRLHSSP
jgi:MIF4G domain